MKPITNDKYCYIVKLGKLYFKRDITGEYYFSQNADDARVYNNRSFALKRAEEIDAQVVEVKTTYKTIQ